MSNPLLQASQVVPNTDNMNIALAAIALRLTEISFDKRPSSSRDEQSIVECYLKIHESLLKHELSDNIDTIMKDVWKKKEQTTSNE